MNPKIHEEEDFYRLNKELIERRRERLDLNGSSHGERRSSSAYRMKCPKCGCQMNELSQNGIRFEKCENCEGVYFSRGEFETLVKTQGAQSFLELTMRLWKLEDV